MVSIQIGPFTAEHVFLFSPDSLVTVMQRDLLCNLKAASVLWMQDLWSILGKDT